MLGDRRSPATGKFHSYSARASPGAAPAAATSDRRRRNAAPCSLQVTNMLPRSTPRFRRYRYRTRRAGQSRQLASDRAAVLRRAARSRTPTAPFRSTATIAPRRPNCEALNSARTQGRVPLATLRRPFADRSTITRSPTPSTVPNPRHAVRRSRTRRRSNAQLQQRVRQHHPRARRARMPTPASGSPRRAPRNICQRALAGSDRFHRATTQNSGSTVSGGRATPGIVGLRQERPRKTASGRNSRAVATPAARQRVLQSRKILAWNDAWPDQPTTLSEMHTQCGRSRADRLPVPPRMRTIAMSGAGNDAASVATMFSARIGIASCRRRWRLQLPASAVPARGIATAVNSGSD